MLGKGMAMLTDHNNFCFLAGHRKKPERFIDMPHSPSKEALTQRLNSLEAELADWKKIELSLKQRLEDYREIVENVNDVFYRIDTGGRFSFMNHVVEYQTGYTPEEFIGRHFSEFIHADDLDKIKKRFAQIISDEDISLEPAVLRFKKKGGGYLWVRTLGRRIRRAGKVLGLTGIWTDIHALKQAEEALKNAHDQLEAKVAERTEELLKINIQLEQEIQIRKNTESALRDSEAHLRSLMEAATNFAVYRLVYDETLPTIFRVVFVSPSIRELLGVAATDDLEKWNEAIHPEDIGRVKDANLRAFETGIFNEIFRIYHSPKQEWRCVHAVSTGIFGENDRTKYINGIFIDVTEQKRAEEALKKRERELETKSRHLEEMNTALRVLLEKREKDKWEIEEKIVYNLRELVFPYLNKLKNMSLDKKQTSYLSIAESNLQSITSTFSKSLSEKFLGLTPTEIQVANLIRQGRSTKEIAQILTVSNRTVESHRKGIRKKLRMKNRKANLRSHLITLSKGPL